MDKQQIISQLVDVRNHELWADVCAKLAVTFEESENSEYSVYTIDNSATFYIPQGDYCADSFTHELLHAHIAAKECYIGGNFRMVMWRSRILEPILDTQLCEHITNCVQHRMMLPRYLSMGFDRSKFLYDYKLHKGDPQFLARIKKLYKEGSIYNRSAIKNLIGKYFAMACDPNPAFDYSKEMKLLLTIDPQLVHAMIIYLNLWDNYDFENDLYRGYADNNETFYNGLKAWLNGKRFA